MSNNCCFKIGTTPIHSFYVPYNAADVKSVRIVYKQDDKVILKKEANECVVGDYCIATRLTQEDTFLFDCNKAVKIQVRVLSINDDAFSSDIINRSIGECLDKEVLV